MFAKGEIKCGDLLWVQFSPSVGHEFQDKRPGLVIQSDEQLRRSNLVTVMPLTGNVRNKLDDDITVEPDGNNNLHGASIIKVYNIESCDYQRIIGKIGKCESAVMKKSKGLSKSPFWFMSDCYYFPGQFKCMYCKVDLNLEGNLCLPAGQNIDLTCPKCGAVWKFFTHVQLDLKLVKGGKFNKK